MCSRVDPGPRMKRVSCSWSTSSFTWSAISSFIASSLTSANSIFPVWTRAGSTRVFAVPYNRTTHSPRRYASSSTSRTSPSPTRRYPRTQASRIVATVAGWIPKTRECIFTPAGIPRIVTRASIASTTSRHVPVPPHNPMTSAHPCDRVHNEADALHIPARRGGLFRPSAGVRGGSHAPRVGEFRGRGHHGEVDQIPDYRDRDQRPQGRGKDDRGGEPRCDPELDHAQFVPRHRP